MKVAGGAGISRGPCDPFRTLIFLFLRALSSDVISRSNFAFFRSDSASLNTVGHSCGMGHIPFPCRLHVLIQRLTGIGGRALLVVTA